MPFRKSRRSVPSFAAATLLFLTLAIALSASGSAAALAQDEPPGRPTGLEVTSQDFHSVVISWDDPEDDGITGYQVMRLYRDGDTYGNGQGAREFVVIEDDTGTADTTYTDYSVTPNTRYAYRVIARNSGGLSERSSYANAETPGPPAQPAGLTVASASDASITVAWDDPQDDSITGYQILRRSRDGDTYGDGQGAREFVAIEDDTGTADTEYADDSVTPETQYVYRVTARNPAGLSERSSYANAETTAAPVAVPQPTPEPRQESTVVPQSTAIKDDQEDPPTAQQQVIPTNVTLSSLTVAGAHVPGFSSSRSEHYFGVASTSAQVTVVATAHPSGAPVSYSTTDADGNIDGHQVSLSAGANRLTITAGPFNEGDVSLGSTGYVLQINRGVADGYGWKAGADIDALAGAGNDDPHGTWSDGTYIWVADGEDLKLYAYQLANRSHVSDRNIGLDSENADPKGIWSNRETIWVVDSSDRDLYAYNLQSGERHSEKDFIDLGDDDADFYGIFSDGETIWLSDKTGPVIEAFDFDTGDKVAGLSYIHLEPSGHDHMAGIWSDGETMWAADPAENLIHSYDSPATVRSLGRSFQTLGDAGNASPGGIWSDGETLWVTDTEDGKIYSYNMPASDNTDLQSITVDGVEVSGVVPGATEFLYRVADSTSQVTLAAASWHQESTVSFNTPDAIDNVDGLQADLRVGSNSIVITVTAPRRNDNRVPHPEHQSRVHHDVRLGRDAGRRRSTWLRQ